MSVFPRKTATLAAVAVMMAVPHIASAQSAAPLSGLFSCEALTNKEAQLACFLTETAKLRGVEAQSDIASPQISVPKNASPQISGTQITANQNKTAAIEQDKLALKDQELKAAREEITALKQEKETKKESKKKPPKKRSVAIKSAEPFGPNRYLRFTLVNGEVWQQTVTGRPQLGRATPDMLTIKRASFGSFIGSVNGKSPTFRMKQIKQAN